MKPHRPFDIRANDVLISAIGVGGGVPSVVGFLAIFWNDKSTVLAIAAGLSVALCIFFLVLVLALNRYGTHLQSELEDATLAFAADKQRLETDVSEAKRAAAEHSATVNNLSVAMKTQALMSAATSEPPQKRRPRRAATKGEGE